MTKASLLFKSLRPHQWVKNGFVLIPLLFAQKVFHFPSLLKSLIALAIFCLLAGAIYLINDLIDLEADRAHPAKKDRPLAAGMITPRLAKVAAGIFLLLSLVSGFLLSAEFFLVVVIYVAVQALYNYRLKDVVILDLFCISSGFFLRMIGGAVAIQVIISHWLIICTVLISIFLALAKRRHELVLLGVASAINHRKVLSEYDPYLLDQMIGVITGSTLLSYMLYCISPDTIEKFQTDRMIYTFPFVLYGILRYLYLIHKRGRGGAPEKVIFSDSPLLISVLLWGFFSMLIVYRVI
ncbi:MAG: decaprenyl-phosphate phosphoribosyltransferase [Desulfobacteraceae bacterium]|nr:decaprenyl-phosphate phosphoribosyltransferase [Desulfobacteraceae bacterium]MBU0733772.1 decaprenyl-phosphate phosphoribosyltransferase [Pseudomonadota bacterium]MBU1932162.1 decaprenyl-phosphate phosphoribosyltransferase [Patescibacteria group bacterium]